MNILVVGGTGLIGSKVAEQLTPNHKLIVAGHNSGDIQTDIENPEAIKELYIEVGPVDAVISTAGSAPMQPLIQATNDHFLKGIKRKMLGQINIALTPMDYVNKNCSVTLTSGSMGHDPLPHNTLLGTI